MSSQLYASVTDTTEIVAISVSDAHSAPTATATINALDTGLDVGSAVSVDIGYVGDHHEVFTGYVKNVERKQAPHEYIITASNMMIRAVDFFIAASDPEEPFTRDHIKAEDLVGDLMALAGINDYVGESSDFTFGIHTEVEVNLTSVYDYSKFIADIIAYSVYADEGGTVHFKYRPPFPNGGGTTATLSNSNILDINYSVSDRDLRNRVVVYGAEGIHAEAQASSPYLPDGFYKSIVVAAPGVIDTQGMAEKAANYNLNLLNRLTKNGQISIVGDAGISCRDNVTVSKSDIGMTGTWYVYSCEHSWNKGGYITQLDVRK